MNIHLIAIHINDENKIVGFRLYDLETGKFMDTDYDSVYNQIIGHSFNITGIRKSSFDDGSLLEYPILYKGKIQKNNKPIFLDFKDKQYIVCNWNGKLEKLDKDYFLHIKDRFGMLNEDYTFYI